MLDGPASPPRARLRRSAALHRAAAAVHDPGRSTGCSSTGCDSLMRAFGKAYERAMADPTFRAQFRLTDWEERLIAREPGLAEPSPTSRLDAFVMDEAGTMALTEYNAETPAGAGYNDALVDRPSPTCRSCGRSAGGTRSVPLPARHGVLHVLLDAYEAVGGPARAAADRHRRLARRADPQRVRAVPGVLHRGRHRVRHRRPARAGVSRRPALRAAVAAST